METLAFFLRAFRQAHLLTASGQQQFAGFGRNGQGDVQVESSDGSLVMWLEKGRCELNPFHSLIRTAYLTRFPHLKWASNRSHGGGGSL